LYTEFLDHDRACWLGERVAARSRPLVLDVRSLFATDAYRTAFRAALDEGAVRCTPAGALARHVPQRRRARRWCASASSRKLASVVACPRDAMLVGAAAAECRRRRERAACATPPAASRCAAARRLRASRSAISDKLFYLGEIFHLQSRACRTVLLLPLAAAGRHSLTRRRRRTRRQLRRALRASCRRCAHGAHNAAAGQRPARLVVGDLLEASVVVSRDATQSTPATRRLACGRADARVDIACSSCDCVDACGWQRCCSWRIGGGQGRVERVRALCEVHDVGRRRLEVRLMPSVTVQFATRAARTTLRFAGDAAALASRGCAANSCIVVTAVSERRLACVDDDALVFSVCFDESAAVRGDEWRAFGALESDARLARERRDDRCARRGAVCRWAATAMWC
jgi:hypothetical protein